MVIYLLFQSYFANRNKTNAIQFPSPCKYFSLRSLRAFEGEIFNAGYETSTLVGFRRKTEWDLAAHTCLTFALRKVWSNFLLPTLSPQAWRARAALWQGFPRGTGGQLHPAGFGADSSTSWALRGSEEATKPAQAAPKYPVFGQGDNFRDSPPERTRSHRGQLWEVLLFFQVCCSSTELVHQSDSCINKNKPQKSIPEKKIAVWFKFRFLVLSEPLHDT